MDLSKIFLKDACPTTIGGQAVMEGVMMRGVDRMATSIRLPDGRIHIETQALPKTGAWMKIPVLRGVFAFVMSLVTGMKTLTYSADVLEYYTPDDEETKEEPGAFSKWIEKHFGERAAWNFALYIAVILAILFSVVIFILLPTVAVNLLSKFTESKFLLNLCEGVLRLLIFIIYIAAIGRMKDIQRTFEYHGAEHKTIHCFENNLELTPENAQEFYTLHPRCGTSFLMFVMVISLIIFSLLGWPNIWVRLLSRILLLPVVAGISYELLKWAGRSDNIVVKILSMPGLLLQKLTTREPSKEQLEVAIASMKAVMVDADTPYIEGICDVNANLVEEKYIASEPGKEDVPEKGATPEKSDIIDKGVSNEEENEMSDTPIIKKARDMGTGFLDKILGREKDVDEYGEEYYDDYDEYDALEEEFEVQEETPAPKRKPWQMFKHDDTEDKKNHAEREDRGFMNFFSKQHEEVGTAPSGRAKNAAGIPIWDDEAEIKKAKE